MTVRPKPKLIWRPRNGLSQVSGDPHLLHQPRASHDSGDPHLSIQSGADLAVGIEPESALIPISSNLEPRVEIRALFCEAMTSVCIDRTWGSSSE
jgi:hypothetical protein